MSDDLEIHDGAYGSRGGAGHGPEDRDHNVAVPSAVSQRPSSTLPVMKIALVSPDQPLLDTTAALFWPVPVGGPIDGAYVAACVTDPAVLTDADRLAAEIEGCDAVCSLLPMVDPPAGPLAYRWHARRRRRRVRALEALRDAVIATGIERWVQRSSTAVYADGGATWLTEASPVAPSPAVETALRAEEAVAEFAAAGGDGVVLRMGALYGPDEQATANLVLTARRGWDPLVGPGYAYRSLVTTADAAAAVRAALVAPPGIYDVVDGDPLTVCELSHVLSVGVATELHPLGALLSRPDSEIANRSHRVAGGRLRATTGWAPMTPSAREGLPVAAQSIVAGAARQRDHTGPRELASS